jgi:hypothetical protein
LQVINRLVFDCTLLDQHNQIIASKQFSRSVVVARSQDSLFKDSFDRFEYRRLAQRALYPIERHFRNYLIDR